MALARSKCVDNFVPHCKQTDETFCSFILFLINSYGVSTAAIVDSTLRKVENILFFFTRSADTYIIVLCRIRRFNVKLWNISAADYIIYLLQYINIIIKLRLYYCITILLYLLLYLTDRVETYSIDIRVV